MSSVDNCWISGNIKHEEFIRGVKFADDFWSCKCFKPEDSDFLIVVAFDKPKNKNYYAIAIFDFELNCFVDCNSNNKIENVSHFRPLFHFADNHLTF